MPPTLLKMTHSQVFFKDFAEIMIYFFAYFSGTPISWNVSYLVAASEINVSSILISL